MQKINHYSYHPKGLSSVKEKIIDFTVGKKLVLLLPVGFLLARAQILGEMMPFGLAFLVAVAVVQRGVWPVLIVTSLGTATAITGLPLFLHLAVITGLALGIQIYSQVVNSHWLKPPVAVFAANFVIKAAGYLFFEPGIYYWVIALVESLLAGGITVIFIYTLSNLDTKKFSWDKLVPEEMASLLVISLGIIIGLAELSIWGLTLKSVISKLAIQAGALLYGPGAAAIMGAIIGVIPGSNNTMSPAFAGILAFSGVLAGVFRQFNKVGVITGFILGNLIFTVYLADQTTIAYYLGETLLAGLILLILPLGKFHPLMGMLTIKMEPIGFGSPPKKNNDELAKRRVKELSQIFREIAHTFAEAVDATQIAAGFELVAENVKNKLCRECPSYKKCWLSNGDKTLSLVGGMGEKLASQEKVTYYDLPGSFQKQCRQGKEFALALACSFDTWQVNNFWQRQFCENGKLVPEQLEGISEIMDNLAEEIGVDNKDRKYLERNLQELVREKGIKIKELHITGNTSEGPEIMVTQVNCGGKNDCGEITAVAAMETFSRRMKVEKIYCNLQKTKGTCQYQLKPYLPYKLTVGKSQATKTGSPLSGDSYSFLPLTEGKYAIILSDGMGTGQKARLESNTAVMLLEHLLESGFDKEIALKTINSILVLRSKEERFATLDLAIIDLYSGQLEHTKIGAVPSFLKRGTRVGVVTAESLPIGILHNVESVTITEQLQAGDVLILVSDGVLEAEQKMLEKENWVRDLLVKLCNDDPQEIADQIMFQARILSAEQNRDDMTVLVARLDTRLH